MTRPQNRTVRSVAVVALTFAALAFTGAGLFAGPLNPPAGAVAPTAKPLAEVEPRTAISLANTPGDADSLFKITQPGSYYLTGNITGVVGKHGVEIVTSGVTLDLNGFDLVGVPGSVDGVSTTTSSLSNITVVNGSVRDWGADGVDLGGFGATSCRVEGVLVSGNAGLGIRTGIAGVVSNCSAYNNGDSGINVSHGSTVSNCTAFLNSGNGITTGAGSTVSNCSAYNNTLSGISALFGSGSTILNCTARFNTLNGIVCNATSTIRDNSCSNNGSGGDGAGIHVTGTDNRIEGNNCTSADRGIDVDAGGNIIIRNTCSGNTVNWDVVAGNKCLVVVGANAAAISGDSGGVAIGSTDPNANFTY